MSSNNRFTRRRDRNRWNSGFIKNLEFKGKWGEDDGALLLEHLADVVPRRSDQSQEYRLPHRYLAALWPRRAQQWRSIARERESKRARERERSGLRRGVLGGLICGLAGFFRLDPIPVKKSDPSAGSKTQNDFGSLNPLP